MRAAVNFKVRTLPVFFEQVSNNYIWMNASINLEFLLEIVQYFVWAKCKQKKKSRDLNRLTV